MSVEKLDLQRLELAAPGICELRKDDGITRDDPVRKFHLQA